MPCCFQSPWQWGHFIQYSPPHSPMDEIFRGGIWKLFPKGWLCRHSLIFRIFLRGMRKKSLYICFVFLKGGCCVVTFDLFFLGWVKVNSPYPRGGGGGWLLNGMVHDSGVSGLLFSDFLWFFLLIFSSDRPTQNQETLSTLKERKGDGLKQNKRKNHTVTY